MTVTHVAKTCNAVPNQGRRPTLSPALGAAGCLDYFVPRPLAFFVTLLPAAMPQFKCCACTHWQGGKRIAVTEHNIGGLQALFAATGRAGADNLVVGGKLCGQTNERKTQSGSAWTTYTTSACCSEAEMASLKKLMIGKPVSLILEHEGKKRLCDGVVRSIAGDQPTLDATGAMTSDARPPMRDSRRRRLCLRRIGMVGRCAWRRRQRRRLRQQWRRWRWGRRRSLTTRRLPWTTARLCAAVARAARQQSRVRRPLPSQRRHAAHRCGRVRAAQGDRGLTTRCLLGRDRRRAVAQHGGRERRIPTPQGLPPVRPRLAPVRVHDTQTGNRSILR